MVHVYAKNLYFCTIDMNRRLLTILITGVLAIVAASTAQGQSRHARHINKPAKLRPMPEPEAPGADTATFNGFADLVLPDSGLRTDFVPLIPADFRRPVFDNYQPRPYPGGIVRRELTPAERWLDTPARQYFRDEAYNDSLIDALSQNFMFAHAELVRYNVRVLPEPPKRYRAVIDPSTLRLVMEEVTVTPDELPGTADVDVERANWLHTFNASVQFSQAYISPNWYQGGNDALSMIGTVAYGVKLNRKFYPKLLAEADVSYKLALTSAPDDSLRKYSITEDLFQLNAKGGFKALKNWFYTVTLNFKTQFFNNYPVNSRKLAAGFLSPGELNLGLGMTYDLVRPKNRVTLNASISPVSWNLKTCTDHRLDPTTVGIDSGHRTKSQIGSSTEIKFHWGITRDIDYDSRIFAFTQYEDSQIDWENTINFSINRFLSTQLYVHLRYDSTTPRADDSKWHRWQLKEILSLGFQYKFSTI